MKKRLTNVAIMMALALMVALAGSMNVQAAPDGEDVIIETPAPTDDTGNENSGENNLPTGGWFPLQIGEIVFIKIFEEPEIPEETPTHVHSYEWVEINAPTENSAGLTQYRCSSCGQVDGTQPISTATGFVKKITHLIESAPEGSTVEINAGVWRCYTARIMELLAENNVNLKTIYVEDGVEKSFTIPADKIPMGEQFYGFKFLELLFAE